MDSPVKKQALSETFRYITPLLLIILTAVCTLATGKLTEIDNKLFTHLTNHEMHVPRSQIVQKAEFDLQCKMSDEKTKEIMNSQRDIITNLISIQKDLTNLSITVAKLRGY